MKDSSSDDWLFAGESSFMICIASSGEHLDLTACNRRCATIVPGFDPDNRKEDNRYTTVAVTKRQSFTVFKLYMQQLIYIE